MRQMKPDTGWWSVMCPKSNKRVLTCACKGMQGHEQCEYYDALEHVEMVFTCKYPNYVRCKDCYWGRIYRPLKRVCEDESDKIYLCCVGAIPQQMYVIDYERERICDNAGNKER